MKDTLSYIWEVLHQRNHKSFYLAFTRVALSLWLLKELMLNWSSRYLLFSSEALASPLDTGVQRVLGLDLNFFHLHFTFFLIVYALLLVLNIIGFGKWITSLLVFLIVDFLLKQNIYFYSGGERMVRVMLLYLVFANTYEYFSLRPYQLKRAELRRLSNLLSNLASISIMLQLCVAYLASALSKMTSALWQKGIATYYIFQLDSYKGSRWNDWMAKQRWLVYFSTYFTLAFELLFPFMVWIKKTRKYLLPIGILFHLGIYIFMMIYGFQVIFILCYGFFVPNSSWIKLYNRLVVKKVIATSD